MSDAFSEMARTRDRTENYEAFMKDLAQYLSNPSDKLLTQLRGTASYCEFIPEAFIQQHSGRGATISACLDELLSKLGSKDNRVWADILHTLQEESSNEKLYKTLNNLSPFAGKVIVKAYRGNGFISVNTTGIQKALDDRLAMDDHEEYFIAIPEEDLKKLI